MEKSLFEQMGGTYKQEGDYLLPDVELPEEKPIGVWGCGCPVDTSAEGRSTDRAGRRDHRHYHHLRKTKRILFSQLIVSGKMNDYLADIDLQAEEMFSQLVKQLAERDGITEELKAENQMLWVQRTNAVRETATEIVNNDLIYA